MRPSGLVSIALAAAFAAPAIGMTKAPSDPDVFIDFGPITVVGASDVPLYDNLGDHHYEVTTASEKAQAYFDQGLRLYYAFNHQEAIRSFREAQRIDPDCAMCWWGEALSWGPNINLPMDQPSGEAAYAAIVEARSRKAHASERERAMIDALAERYVAVQPLDRSSLDRAYAEAMGDLRHAYPRDHEIRVLWAESLMTLRPWDYWTADGEPQPGIADALANLESVVEADEEHPGACHFYIHAVEKLYPELAVPCAERLADLMPGAGHLVHMPGHIYIRVGRYLDAVNANKHAVHADETYIADQMPGMGMYTAGYYPHNYDFMAFAAMMIGRRSDAIESAQKVADLIPEEMFGAEGMDFLQHWSQRPLQLMVRFERWDDIMAVAAPPESRAHSRALWHYARGAALAASGRTRMAEAELAALRDILAGDGLDGLRMEFNLSTDLIPIAERVLTGRVALAKGRTEEAVEAMRGAVRFEGALLYGEPPEWTVPTRQELGSALLEAGRYREAEQAFEEDLDHFPDNVWSLNGLAMSLDARGLPERATEVRARLDEILEAAGVEPEVVTGR